MEDGIEDKIRTQETGGSEKARKAIPVEWTNEFRRIIGEKKRGTLIPSYHLQGF